MVFWTVSIPPTNIKDEASLKYTRTITSPHIPERKSTILAALIAQSLAKEVSLEPQSLLAG
jgi:hypothetical protein